MKVFSLFSGIGGFEKGLVSHGIDCVGFCEIEDAASSVLEVQFPGTTIHKDVTRLTSIPKVDLITAGFPCQDLSQAGPKSGIGGARSSLVDEVFRLVKNKKSQPDFVLLENVSYMLRLHKGASIKHIISNAETLGYRWAYRVIDARTFGLPQRRERVVFLMSNKLPPEDILFPSGHIETHIDDSVGNVDPKLLYGFYWTEGKRGLGWTKNAVPTIKGGSGIGIPSPPAIWDPANGFFGTPAIEDAERMFGFPAGWTQSSQNASSKAGARWKLLGNSICVPMVDWVGQQIRNPIGFNAHRISFDADKKLPIAAFGGNGKAFGVDVTTWVQEAPAPNLRNFLKFPMKPLSLRAASGFYSRATDTKVIKFADGFLASLKHYIDNHTEGLI